MSGPGHVLDDLGYVLIARQVLADTAPHESWTQQVNDFWCYLRPPGPTERAQGGELHLSATPGSAEDVLVRAVAVLARHRVAFRFARDPRHLRGTGGDFLTAYPDDPDQLRAVAADLHLAGCPVRPRAGPGCPAGPGSPR